MLLGFILRGSKVNITPLTTVWWCSQCLPAKKKQDFMDWLYIRIGCCWALSLDCCLHFCFFCVWETFYFDVEFLILYFSSGVNYSVTPLLKQPPGVGICRDRGKWVSPDTLYIIYQWNWGGDGMEVISFILWLNISGPSACHPTARQLQSKKRILVCHWTFLGVMFLSTHTRQQAELSILSFFAKNASNCYTLAWLYAFWRENKAPLKITRMEIFCLWFNYHTNTAAERKKATSHKQEVGAVSLHIL